MIFVTGDTHGNFTRFNTDSFPEQKDMTKNDYVIVCGDFGGIWDQKSSKTERYWLDWLDNKPFTTLFVSGNHENYDRLDSDEFPLVDFKGSKARQISKSVFYLQRGCVYTIEDKTFFTFGGAASHDIQDGVLEKEDVKKIKEYTKLRKMFRVNHLSWWKEEMPNDEEFAYGLSELEKVNYDVDFVITHDCPTEILSLFSNGLFKSDKLNMYFNDIALKLKFKRWFFGHYHDDRNILSKYLMMYWQILRIN